MIIVGVMMLLKKGFMLFLVAFLYLPMLLADEVTVSEQATVTRYGLFDWLDHRSEYGQGVFPEPFLVDDSDLEPGEARVDWLHTAAGSLHNDEVKMEAEKAFGVVTLELEVPFVREASPGGTLQGFGNIDLGARCPFYQFVSANGWVDSTLGVAAEVGIPTGSEVSQNAELVPKLFDDLKIGNFTLQSVLGYSTLFGPGPDGGLQAFEYGFVFRLYHPAPGFAVTGSAGIRSDFRVNRRNGVKPVQSRPKQRFGRRRVPPQPQGHRPDTTPARSRICFSHQ